jgi:hypothetical protein
MGALDDIHDGHGVEAIRDPDAWNGDYWQEIAMIYVNQGDMYADTVVYDVDEIRFEHTTVDAWLDAYKQRVGYSIREA